MIRTGAAFSANCNCQPGLRVVWRGGNLNNGRNAGRSYSNLNNDPSNSNANRGSLSLFYIYIKTRICVSYRLPQVEPHTLRN